MTIRDFACAVRGTIRACALAAALIASACGAQPGHGAPAQSQPAVAVGSAKAGKWYLLLPPQRAYSSDRSPMMGGPLASPPRNAGEFHGAYEIYSLTQIDQSALLNKWQKAMEFGSGQDCEDYKAAQLKQTSDPAANTRMSERTRERLIDPTYMRSIVESERCTSAAEINALVRVQFCGVISLRSF